MTIQSVGVEEVAMIQRSQIVNCNVVREQEARRQLRQTQENKPKVEMKLKGGGRLEKKHSIL